MNGCKRHVTLVAASLLLMFAQTVVASPYDVEPDGDTTSQMSLLQFATVSQASSGAAAG